MSTPRGDRLAKSLARLKIKEWTPKRRKELPEIRTENSALREDFKNEKSEMDPGHFLTNFGSKIPMLETRKEKDVAVVTPLKPTVCNCMHFNSGSSHMGAQSSYLNL